MVKGWLLYTRTNCIEAINTDPNGTSSDQTQTSSRTKRKPVEARSDVWEDFVKYRDEAGQKKSKCKHCGSIFSEQGTPLHTVPVGSLASLLANASPAEQRMMFGESLYPLVEQLLHLLESPEALRAKVEEAMEVLRNVSLQQQAINPADHLAELSLNDQLCSGVHF